MTEKDLIPKCPRGEEFEERFNQFHFRKNPHESPMARALLLHGYDVKTHPLQAQYTDEDWLGSRVAMKGLTIIFRQPTPIDLLVCRIDRESREEKMTSPLLGFMEFSAFCHYHCPEVECLGGCIDKLAERNTEEGFKMDRLIRYYHRLLGGIEGSYINGYFWIYADMHYKKRFETLPIWKRYRREHGES